MTVQTTFTRQKREAAKAGEQIAKLRAQETRQITFTLDGEVQSEIRESYIEIPPEKITASVLEIIGNIISMHAARQQANSRNKGRFSWQGIEVDLTVPQLRVLKEAHGVLQELAAKLPRRNPRHVPNTTVDGRPAFAHGMVDVFERRKKALPVQRQGSNVNETFYAEEDVVVNRVQTVEVDYGYPADVLDAFHELISDLETAIQIAIDEANARGHEADAEMEALYIGIREVLSRKLGLAE